MKKSVRETKWAFRRVAGADKGAHDASAYVMSDGSQVVTLTSDFRTRGHVSSECCQHEEN
jgi:hypothetical protein